MVKKPQESGVVLKVLNIGVLYQKDDLVFSRVTI
jgi:hypothetical protein